jgi:hypothetical protein
MSSNFAALAAELLRALRGKRSQRAFSKRLGYRSNIAYRWECARCFPTAAEGLHVAARAGVDVGASLRRFLRNDAPWLRAKDVASPAGVARLLRELRGKTPLVELARRSPFSRFAIARWLKGTAQPRLHEFLELIELTSLRALDFVAELVDPARLPSAAERWKRLEAARNAAYDHPWSHAVLRGLELEDYRKLGRHRSGWLARRLGIPLKEEQGCLELLDTAGQIRLENGLWRVNEVSVVDTRRDRERSHTLKSFWLRTAVDRYERGAEGIFSYNLMAVAEADLPRLRELHVQYFQALRALVAESVPSERVVLFSTQLFPLDAALE